MHKNLDRDLIALSLSSDRFRQGILVLGAGSADLRVEVGIEASLGFMD
jgi:hypothetical protein